MFLDGRVIGYGKRLVESSPPLSPSLPPSSSFQRGADCRGGGNGERQTQTHHHPPATSDPTHLSSQPFSLFRPRIRLRESTKGAQCERASERVREVSSVPMRVEGRGCSRPFSLCWFVGVHDQSSLVDPSDSRQFPRNNLVSRRCDHLCTTFYPSQQMICSSITRDLSSSYRGSSDLVISFDLRSTSSLPFSVGDGLNKT